VTHKQISHLHWCCFCCCCCLWWWRRRRKLYTPGMRSPCFFVDSDSDSGLIMWHTDCVLKDDL